MKDIVILGGRVIDPATGLDANREVLLREGRIAAVDVPGTWKASDERTVIDAKNCIVAPGLIDIHVHLREPGQTWKETIATGTAAAAAGGFTTVVAMPNTVPVNDTVEKLQWMLDPKRGAVVHVMAMPAVTRGSMGEHLNDFAALRAAGAAGFTDDGKPVLEDGVMRAALVDASMAGVPLSQHAEDTRLTGGCSMNAGALAFRLGLRGMTVEAEARIVERDLRLLRDIERTEKLHPHLHVQHISTARALDAVRQAKAEGLHVTCEAAPHHFTLTEDAVRDYNTNAKMNPPLRNSQDRDAVLAGLLDGTIDCIATDHAPHAAFEKEVEFERAPNGITGLETALGLSMRVLHRERGLALTGVLKLMSTAPAKILGLVDRGTLSAGAIADVVVFDPAKEWKFSVSATRSQSRNTPFEGAAMVGAVKATVSQGQIVFGG